MDTSFYPKPAPPVNPLAAIGSYATTSNALLQNQQMQAEFAARKAIGEAAKNSLITDPATGEVRQDLEKFYNSLLADPRVAYRAPAEMSAALDRQIKQTQMAKEKLELAKGYNSAALTSISSLLIDPNADDRMAFRELSRLFSMGAMDEKSLAIMAQSIPRWEEKPGEAAETRTERRKQYLQDFRAVVKPWALQSGQQKDNIDRLIGQIKDFDLGSHISVAQVSPGAGIEPIGKLAKGLTPSEASAPRSFLMKTPDGKGSVKVEVPHQAWLALQAAAGPLPVDVPLDVNNLNPAQANAIIEVFDPKTNQNRKTTVANFLRDIGQTGSVASAPPLGAQSAADTAGKAAADAAQKLQDTAGQAPARKAALFNMMGELDKFTSGPGTDWVSFAKGLANANLPVNLFDPKAISSREGFIKQSAQIALQQFASLGGSGLASAMDASIKANPSSALSNMGNREISALLLGNEDAIQTMHSEWENWKEAGKGPETYGAFVKDFNKQYDPRVFQLPHMDKAGREHLLSSMKPDEGKKFMRSMFHALSKGWIEPIPGLGM